MGFHVAQVLDMEERRRHLAAKKGFDPWSRRFGASFDDDTSIRRLENPLLKELVRGGEEATAALYDLIMGISGMGAGTRFHYLESEKKMEVTDVALFLLDLLRFEAMYRLGWLEDYPALSVSLLDLVQNFKKRFSCEKQRTPALSPAHPGYSQYLAEFETDRGAFVRRLIPEAIRVFCSRRDDTGKT